MTDSNPYEEIEKLRIEQHEICSANREIRQRTGHLNGELLRRSEAISEKIRTLSAQASAKSQVRMSMDVFG